MTTSKKLHLFSDDSTRNPPQIRLENEALLLQPMQQVFCAVDTRVRGFPDYPEAPRFRQFSTRGRPISDVEGWSNYWLVSQRAKQVLAEVEEKAFAFVECDMVAKDGSPLEKRFLCDVLPILDLLDENSSDARIQYYDDRKTYNLMGATSFVFRTPPENTRVFRMAFAEYMIICDERMRDAIKTAKLRGFTFSAAVILRTA